MSVWTHQQITPLLCARSFAICKRKQLDCIHYKPRHYMFGGKVDRQTLKERHSMGTMDKQFVKDVTRESFKAL